jgi:hypothetical protein
VESRSRRRPSNTVAVSRTVTARAEAREPTGPRWWLVIAPLAVLVLAATLILPAGRHEWALSIFKQPTPYTALSFDKSWAMPTTVVRGNPLPISFVIDNKEGRTVQYRYVVSESSPGVSGTLAHSTKKVEAGRSSTVHMVIRPTCLVSPCRIQVSLPGNSESIDFLTAVKA